MAQDGVPSQALLPRQHEVRGSWVCGGSPEGLAVPAEGPLEVRGEGGEAGLLLQRVQADSVSEPLDDPRARGGGEDPVGKNLDRDLLLLPGAAGRASRSESRWEVTRTRQGQRTCVSAESAAWQMLLAARHRSSSR
eukprot:762749-Hanusia_phi.AAC.4